MNSICLSMAVLVSVLLPACGQSSQDLYIASDHTKEDVFTSGIEGPCVGLDGNLYVVNYERQGTIGKVMPNGDSELYVTLPEGSIGNGIRIDQDGHLYIADYTGHNVLKIDPADKSIAVHAHNDAMNQPNDLAIASDGTIYCSDPNWKEGTGNLWRVDTDGSTHLLAENMGTTNGIELNPQEDKLYVNESVQRKVWQFDLVNGQLASKTLLIDFPDFGFDGMRSDTEGNLYITRHGKGTVVIVSPSGEILEEIQLKGTKPSNIAFGGDDGKTCYITLQDRGCIETFRSAHAGRSFAMKTKKQ